jgi:hypothetical protein
VFSADAKVLRAVFSAADGVYVPAVTFFWIET